MLRMISRIVLDQIIAKMGMETSLGESKSRTGSSSVLPDLCSIYWKKKGKLTRIQTSRARPMYSFTLN